MRTKSLSIIMSLILLINCLILKKLLLILKWIKKEMSRMEILEETLCPKT